LDCVVRLMKEETKTSYTYRAFIEKFRHHRLGNRDFVDLDYSKLYEVIKPYLVKPEGAK